jgi:GTP-binding protein
MTAPRLELLPPPGIPEVAFAGRSNVGKSSLMNALVGRSGLARTSNTPGRTQALNLFAVGAPPRLTLVDMPGYGYAQAPRDLVRRWTRLVGDYLRGRPNLARVLLLVDSRHGLKPADRDILALLGAAAVSTQIVLTKADKPRRDALAAVVEATAREGAAMAHVFPRLLVTSSASGLGIGALRAAVLAAAEPGLAEALQSADGGAPGEGAGRAGRQDEQP